MTTSTSTSTSITPSVIPQHVLDLAKEVDMRSGTPQGPDAWDQLKAAIDGDVAAAFMPLSMETVERICGRFDVYSWGRMLAYAVQQHTGVAPRSRVDALKAEWLHDPYWDIKDSGEEYDTYRDELAAFQAETEARWAKELAKRQDERYHALVARAAGLGCSLHLMKLIEGLEHDIERLDARLSGVES